jgi:2'-5' RNA ligase
MKMQKQEKSYRLFFALWPTDRVRQSIVETLSSISPAVKGRVMKPENIHITLHFIGQVAEPVKDCLHAAAQSVRAETFQLNLDSFGHFKKARIFWVGCQQVPDQLIHLHSDLGAAIAPCGYQPDRRPYAPHLTLLRKSVSPVSPQINFTIPWRIDHFVLVESVTHQEGVEYRLIEKYALC